MRMTTAVVCVLGMTLMLSGTGETQSGGGSHGTYAVAEFELDHGNDCTRTIASIEVFRDPASPPRNRTGETRATITYAVIGQPTSPGCDELFYIDLVGTEELPAGAFVVHPSHHSASLQATLSLFDGESGGTYDVDVTAEWTAAGGGRSRNAIASLGIASPLIDSFVFVNPLFPSTSARVVRLR
jgi:hypothetical protein